MALKIGSLTTPSESTISTMKKKVLLLLSGELRTYDHPAVLRGWSKFFNKYDTTTFLCCWDNRGRSLYSKKHYSDDTVQEDESVNLEQVKKVFPTNNIKLFNYDSWLNSRDLQFWMGQHRSDQFFNSVFAAFFLRKQVFKLAMENIEENKSDFDGVFLTRPDMFFIRELPDYPFTETECIWQQNPPECFFANRVYDNFLFSDIKNIKKVCELYDSPLFQGSIESNFGTQLHYLDPCKILYSYFTLAKIDHKSYDYLYTEPFRRDQDLKNHRDHYLGGGKLWCEK